MKILQEKLSLKHNDSFWYDGKIAETKWAILFASGDIEILDSKTGSRVFARGKRYADEYLPENDEELSKTEEKGLVWEHNNWFECAYKTKDGDFEWVLGDVCYNYDEGLEMLKEYSKANKNYKAIN